MTTKARRDASPSLTICVINYNGENCLAATLTALLEVTARVDQRLFVDDRSTDGSVELVRDKFPEFELIQLPQNRGPAAARNAGFRRAESELVLFVDNDAVLPPETPSALLDALRGDPDATLAMPRVLYAHEPGTIQYDGANSHFIGLMKLENENLPVERAVSQIRRIGSLVTCCFLMDRRRWGRAEPFDERLSYLLEDHELGLRARILGHAVLSVPTECYHGLGTEGLSLRRSNRYADVRVRNLIRNRWVVLLKNYQGRTLLVLSPYLLLFEAFQLIGVIKKGWYRHWRAALREVIDGRRGIRLERREVQAARQKDDVDVLSGGSLPFSDRLLGGRLETFAQRLMDATATAYWRVARRLI